MNYNEVILTKVENKSHRVAFIKCTHVPDCDGENCALNEKSLIQFGVKNRAENGSSFFCSQSDINENHRL